ncbi:hypothetical protein WH158_12855 [Gluconobacter cerinus]|uniref:hypothetical protein n=1 Tax=Gluconobacter cerinus TaxID=38307 RepID=UPI0030B06117
MTPDELKDEIRVCDPMQFCKDRLFGSENWLFEEYEEEDIFGTYDEFKSSISKISGVNKKDIKLAGSSRFGISMSPKTNKFFRKFNDESDLDIVIVSSDLFNYLWNNFRYAYYNGYPWIKDRHSGDVFRIFLHLVGNSDYGTKYLRTISTNFNKMSAEVSKTTGISRDLKYRIYNQWDDAHLYHASGIKKLKDKHSKCHLML